MPEHKHRWVVEVDVNEVFEFDLDPDRTTRRQGRAVRVEGVYDYETNDTYPWIEIENVLCVDCGVTLDLFLSDRA